MNIVLTKVIEGVTTTLTLEFADLYKTDDVASEVDPAEKSGLQNVATVKIVGNTYLIANKITGEQTIF